MPNKTIYVSDEDLPVFKKAQDLAGESLSAVIVNALKKYIIDTEAWRKGFTDIVLWDGTEDVINKSVRGKRIKFMGRKLSSCTGTDPRNDAIHYEYNIYQGASGKFLLHTVIENQGSFDFENEIISEFSKFRTMGLPGRLLMDAEKQLPEIPCEEIDV